MVPVRMTPAQKAMLDKARGSSSASEHIRKLIVADVRRSSKTGD
jgi:hypothetical protein